MIKKDSGMTHGQGEKKEGRLVQVKNQYKIF
jgi:hypothetical protein